MFGIMHIVGICESFKITITCRRSCAYTYVVGCESFKITITCLGIMHIVCKVVKNKSLGGVVR